MNKIFFFWVPPDWQHQLYSSIGCSYNSHENTYIWVNLTFLPDIFEGLANGGKKPKTFGQKITVHKGQDNVTIIAIIMLVITLQAQLLFWWPHKHDSTVGIMSQVTSMVL